MIVLLFGALALLAAACEEGGSIPYSLSAVQYDVDPVFRDFYALLGAQDTLGPAISPLFVHAEVKYQYTVAALLVFDASQAEGQRYHLGALGLDLGIAEPPVSQPEGENTRYINGHIIYHGFVSFYEKLDGIRFVGKPITEVHYNAAKRRYEQHFENLGLFWMEDTPQSEVHLLAYGVWKCDASCRRPPLGNAEVELPYRTAPAFFDSVARLGPDFTGFAISEAYQTPDGFTEQVFANLVLALDPNQPGAIIARALTTRLGYHPEPLRPNRNEAGYYFYAIQGELGYNLPIHLWEYLSKHGGVEIAGPPIGEISQVKSNVHRLCFVNLCLDEEHLADGRLRVYPAALGFSYRLLPVLELRETQALPVYPAPGQSPAQVEAGGAPAAPALPEIPLAQPPALSTDPAPVAPPLNAAPSGEMSVQIWESSPMVSSNQNQEIGVSVFMDGLPLRDVEPDLLVQLPAGDKIYYLFPTGDDGQSRQILEAIEAPNGTLIPYEVCIYARNSDRFCVRDSFLIWQNP